MQSLSNTFGTHVEKSVLAIHCIAGLENIYPSEHFLNQSAKFLPQISGLRICCPSRKSGYEMNLTDLLCLVLLERRVK